MQESQQHEHDLEIDPFPGMVLGGRFVVRETLGHGGSGIVLSAIDLLLDETPVALKILSPHLVDSAAAHARFSQEVLLARQLSSPNVVRTFEFGQLPSGHCYIVMELVQGATLAAFASSYPGGAVPLDIATALLADIARGLAHAHERGIVHRDLKPQNVLVRLGGDAVISDFGISHHQKGADEAADGDDFDGTPHYLAPERLQGAPGDAASDIYAFGVLAFELLTGKKPFDGQTFYTIALAHLCDPIPTLRSTAAPQWLAAAIEKCLEKKPENRFESAAQLVTLFESAPFDTRLGKRRTQKALRWALTARRMRRTFRNAIRTVVFLALLLACLFAWRDWPRIIRVSIIASIELQRAGYPRLGNLVTYPFGFRVPGRPTGDLINTLIEPIQNTLWNGHDIIIRNMLFPLIRYADDRELEDRYGRNALSLAIQIGQPRIVEALLARNPPINSPRIRKAQPLARAVPVFAADELEVLLTLGADPRLGEHNGTTPFHLASVLGVPRSLELLVNAPVLKGDPALLREALSSRNADGLTPLHLVTAAPESVRREIAETLLDYGADLSAVDLIGRNPLHGAVLIDDEQLLRLLLDRADRAAIEQTDLDGRNLLHLAFFRAAGSEPSRAIVQLLIDRGVPIAHADRFGRTPLDYAVSTGSIAEVRALLAQTPRFTRTDESYRALRASASRLDRQTIGSLIDSFADGAEVAK